MSVIGIYDYDFMTYPFTMPNLECAKLYQYFYNHNEIAVLMKELEIDKYNKIYFRKDYDDGKLIKELLSSNVVCGGRSFSPYKYLPLDINIEKTVPNFSIYQRFMEKQYFKNQYSKTLFFRLLKAQHLRLSINGKDIWDDYLKPTEINNRKITFIFHDYNLADIDNSIEAIKDFFNFVNKGDEIKLKRYIGTKFPITIQNQSQLLDWASLSNYFSLLEIEIPFVMDDEILYYIFQNYKRAIPFFSYNLNNLLFNENHFLDIDLPKIYKQLLFLQSKGIKFSLKYSNKNLLSEGLINFLDLLQNYAQRIPVNNKSISLYHYVRGLQYQKMKRYIKKLNIEEMRNAFQYIRIKNYDLFKNFYEVDGCYFKNGGFHYERD